MVGVGTAFDRAMLIAYGEPCAKYGEVKRCPEGAALYDGPY